MSNIRIETLGCRLNTYESEAIRVFCQDSGLNQATIINTCAVTSEAVKKAQKYIRRCLRQKPNGLIIVTGCAAQTEPETFSKMKGVDFVLGNVEKIDPKTWKKIEEQNSKPYLKRVQLTDIMKIGKIKPLPINGLKGRSRAYVQIQNGCDHRCTFCIIPFGRGNSRSVPTELVLEQVQRLVHNGFKEVVLTGVDITSWGADLLGKPKLGNLVGTILTRVPNLDRLRLSSIDSIEVDPALADIIISEKRLMPHFHLSLQSGDNMILKRMKRRHSRENAIEFCNLIRNHRPEVTFGADIIAGFPTETEEMFKNSLNLVKECDLTWLHIFPFSPRVGTPAAKMPKVENSEIKNRAARLRSLGETQVINYLKKNVGKQHTVLVESKGKGRTETFAEVILSPDLDPGQLKKVSIVAHNGKQLIGA